MTTTRQPLFLALLACLVLPVPAAHSLAPTQTGDTVPFDEARWTVNATEWRVEEHQGQQCLYLKGGLALLNDVALTDAVIEFDVALTPGRGFVGGVWRVQDADNLELFYLRSHQSGNPDANQYTPAFNGLTAWQLYHGEGYGVPVEYAFDRFIHVVIAFSGTRAEVYIDSEEPTLVVPELKRDVRPGMIGLSAADFNAARFANFSYRTLDRALPDRGVKPPGPPPAGTVATWSVSSAFEGARLDGRHELRTEDLAGLTWTELEAEGTGVTNLARVQGIAAGADTVFARVFAVADEERMVPLSFGYSDRVRLFLNGRLLYAGDNTYRSRDYRYLGTIGLFDQVLLALQKGPNELLLAVSERFGGWGILARLAESEGIMLRARAPAREHPAHHHQPHAGSHHHREPEAEPPATRHEHHDRSAMSPELRALNERYDRAWATWRDRFFGVEVVAGMEVADIGAGRGELAMGLARAVGSEGRAYANELDPEKVKALQSSAAADGLVNLSTHLGTADDPLLPPDRVELAFMVEVLHHVEHPTAFLAALRSELAPHAKLVIVEADINQEGGEHGGCYSDRFETERLAREAGFSVAEVAEHRVEDTLFFVLTARAPE